MSYDHIKSPKKPGLHPYSEKLIFGKTTWGRSNCPSPEPVFLGLTLKTFRSFTACHKKTCQSLKRRKEDYFENLLYRFVEEPWRYNTKHE